MKLKCPKTINQPWLNSESRVLRQKCRQADRKWKQAKLQVSYEILRDCLRTARSTYFSNLINSNAGRPKVLFSTINRVLNPIATTFPEVSSAVCNDCFRVFLLLRLKIFALISQTLEMSLLLITVI